MSSAGFVVARVLLDIGHLAYCTLPGMLEASVTVSAVSVSSAPAEEPADLEVRRSGVIDPRIRMSMYTLAHGHRHEGNKASSGRHVH